ncbi:MAG: hypothetical protein AAF564_14360 [Bacteroidota bacterium]
MINAQASKFGLPVSLLCHRLRMAWPIVVALFAINIAQPVYAQQVNARAEVAAALYAASATQAAAERVADQQIRGLRDKVETLRTSLEETTGEKTALQQQLTEAEENFVTALEEKDRAYKEEIAVFRDAVEDIISTPEGLIGLARFNSGEDEVAFEIWDRLTAARASAREVAKNIEDAADLRSVAVFALESRKRGQQTTAAVIARFQEVTKLDPGVHSDWVELSRLYTDALNLPAAMQAAQRVAETAENERDRALAYNELGNVLLNQKAFMDAQNSFSEALKLRQRLAESDPTNTEWQRDLSVAYNKMGDVKKALLDHSAALEFFSKALSIREQLVDKDSTNTGWQRDLSVVRNKIGDVKKAQGDLAGALANFNKAFTIFESLTRQNPANTGWQRDLSISLERIGDVKMSQGNLTDALDNFSDGMQIAERLTEVDPDNATWQQDLLMSYVKMYHASKDTNYIHKGLEQAEVMKAKEIFTLDDFWLIYPLKELLNQ